MMQSSDAGETAKTVTDETAADSSSTPGTWLSAWRSQAGPSNHMTHDRPASPARLHHLQSTTCPRTLDRSHRRTRSSRLLTPTTPFDCSIRLSPYFLVFSPYRFRHLRRTDAAFLPPGLRQTAGQSQTQKSQTLFSIQDTSRSGSHPNKPNLPTQVPKYIQRNDRSGHPPAGLQPSQRRPLRVTPSLQT